MNHRISTKILGGFIFVAGVSTLFVIIVCCLAYTVRNSVTKLTDDIVPELSAHTQMLLALHQHNELTQKLSSTEDTLSKENVTNKILKLQEDILLEQKKVGREEIFVRLFENTKKLLQTLSQYEQTKQAFDIKFVQAERNFMRLHYETRSLLSAASSESWQPKQDLSMYTLTLLEQFRRLPLAKQERITLEIRQAMSLTLRQILRLMVTYNGNSSNDSLTKLVNHVFDEVEGPHNIFKIRREIIENYAELKKLHQANTDLTVGMLYRFESIRRKTERSVDAVSLAAKKHVWVLFVAGLLSVLMSVSVAFHTGWRYLLLSVMRRLDKLTTATFSLAEGNIDQPIHISGSDEISQMASAVEGFRQNALELLLKEMDLRDEKAKIDAIVDSLSSGIVMVDTDGNSVLWNKAGRQLLAKDQANYNVSQWSEYYGVFEKDGETLYPQQKHPLTRVLLGEQSAESEFVVFSPEYESPQTIYASACPVVVPGAGMIGAVVNLVNISKQEEALKKLEESNSYLKQLAYISTHDLREPALQIVSFGNLVLHEAGDQLSEDARVYFSYMLSGAHRMSTLLDGLLMFAEAGVQALDIELLDFDSLVKDIVQELGFAKQIEVTNSKGTIRADRKLFKRVIVSLIENAVLYNDKNPLVKINLGEDPTHWHISVWDNGIGIDPIHHNKIFKIFKRLHNRDKIPGAGIGLAFCERVVSRHNGKIWVESKLGNGAKFIFTISKNMK